MDLVALAQEVTKNPQVANVLSSVILTGSLVYLYFRQTRIQSAQTSIQERQESWMEANHKPKIRIENLEIEEENGVDILKVSINNIGNGRATNLRVLMKLYVTPIDFPLVFGRGEFMSINGLPELHRITPAEPKENIAEVHFYPHEYPLGEILQPMRGAGGGTDLEPSEQKELEGALCYTNQNIAPNRAAATGLVYYDEMMDRLADTRLTQVATSIILRYSDMGNNEHDIHLGTAVVDLEETPNLNDQEFNIRAEYVYNDPHLNFEKEVSEQGGDLSKTRRRDRVSYIIDNSSLRQLPRMIYTYWKYKRTLP